MALIPLIMPQLGESIAEARIVSFLVQIGESVGVDQDVIEVETNKAVMNVTSPCAGIVHQLLGRIDQSYPVGSTLGFLEVTAEVAEKIGLAEPPHPVRSEEGSLPQAESRPAPAPAVEPTVRGLPVPASASGASYMSPRLKARMNELGLHAADLAGIAGSGAAGRVTIHDFENFLATLETQRLTSASSMRVAVADAMRRSWTRPLATVALPVCLDPVLTHRRRASLKAGPALYALRSLALALAEDGAHAGRLIGQQQIVHPKSIDLGLRGRRRLTASWCRCCETPEPADARGFAQSLQRVGRAGPAAQAAGRGDWWKLIRDRDEFPARSALTWATPIPLPEQTLVLGMGAGRKVPSWDEAAEKFESAVHRGANLTLSFDHRVLDGGRCQYLSSPASCRADGETGEVL